MNSQRISESPHKVDLKVKNFLGRTRFLVLSREDMIIATTLIICMYAYKLQHKLIMELEIFTIIRKVPNHILYGIKFYTLRILLMIYKI
ncbi:uncharacterised protein [Saccharolobus solfataricus]|uniref:Uncharacterized protein n=1 Tax=Saccharolobus solfataricus TaxID=2287 RepID=A0A157T0S0_SACSO|nr:uncharacterised protein [Saccharolobus solfataricus]